VNVLSCPACYGQPKTIEIGTTTGGRYSTMCPSGLCSRDDEGAGKTRRESQEAWNRMCERSRLDPVRAWLDRQILVGISASDRACVERLIDDLEAA
jgi:hypothetical protein